MKPSIHPEYKELTIEFPQGDSFKTKSTYAGTKLILDVDFRKHPAWTKAGVAGASDISAKVNKFNKKVGGFDFSIKKNLHKKTKSSGAKLSSGYHLIFPRFDAQTVLL